VELLNGLPPAPLKGRWGAGNYCIKGIASGYLNFSPLEALTLAIIIQITFKKPKNITIGIPTSMKHKGIASTI
jgi:hypothetical protein